MKGISGLSIRYLKIYKHRTVTTLVGIMLSSLIIYMIFACGYSAYSAVNYNMFVSNMGYEAVYKVTDKEIAKEIISDAPYYGGEGNDLEYAWIMAAYTVNLVAVNDFNAMPHKIKMVYGVYPKTDNAVVVSQSYSRTNRLNVGDTYVEEIFNYSENLEYDVEILEKQLVGIYEETLSDDGFYDNGTYCFSPWSYGYTLMDEEMTSYGGDYYVYVTFSDKEAIENQAKDLSLKYGGLVYNVSDAALSYYAIGNNEDDLSFLAFQAFLLIIAFVAAFVTLFIVRNAFNISVHDRSRDYGTLRCIGMQKKQIVKMILFEALILTIIGTILGIILGHIIGTMFFDILSKNLGFANDFTLNLYGKAVGFTALYSFVTSAYAMISPIQKLYKLNPIDAMRKVEEIKIKKIKPKRGKLISKLFGFEIGYGYKNLMRNKGRFLISVASLSLGVAFFTGIGSGIKIVYNALEESTYMTGSGAFMLENNSQVQELSNILNEMEEVRNLSNYQFDCYMPYHINLDTTTLDEFYDMSFNFLGVESDLFNKFKEASATYNPCDGQVNVIKLNRMENYEIGESFAPDYCTYPVELYVAGSIVLEDARQIFWDYELPYVENGNLFIYEIGGAFRGLDDLYSDTDMMVNSANILKVTLNYRENTKDFDDFVKNSPYYYEDFGYYLVVAYQSIDILESIALIAGILLLLVYMVNSININNAELRLRKDELDTLRVIGMTKKQESKMLYSETCILAFISLILGAVLGTLITSYLMSFILAEEFKIYISWGNIIISAVALFTTSVLTVYFSRE